MLKTLLVDPLALDAKPRMDEMNDIAKTPGYEVVAKLGNTGTRWMERFASEKERWMKSKLVRKDRLDAVVFTLQSVWLGAASTLASHDPVPPSLIELSRLTSV